MMLDFLTSCMRSIQAGGRKEENQDLSEQRDVGSFTSSLHINLNHSCMYLF